MLYSSFRASVSTANLGLDAPGQESQVSSMNILEPVSFFQIKCEMYIYILYYINNTVIIVFQQNPAKGQNYKEKHNRTTILLK